MNIWAGNHYQDFVLTNNQIQRISFEYYERQRTLLKFLMKKDERIFFITPKYPGGVAITKEDNKEFFDEYKQEIKEYAEKYRIRLDDLTLEKADYSNI